MEPIVAMIEAAAAVPRDRAVMDSWFARGLALDPHDYYLHRAKLMYLKLHAPDAEALDFVHKAALDAPPGSLLPLLAFDAHLLSSWVQRGADHYVEHFKRRAVFSELEPLLAKVVKAQPKSPEALNRYAFVAFHGGRLDLAAPAFRTLGDAWSEEIWLERERYDACKVSALGQNNK